MSHAPTEAAPVTQVAEVLDDPAASFWLRQSLRSALERDPVDALNDALVLASESTRFRLPNWSAFT